MYWVLGRKGSDYDLESATLTLKMKWRECACVQGLSKSPGGRWPDITRQSLRFRDLSVCVVS